MNSNNSTPNINLTLLSINFEQSLLSPGFSNVLRINSIILLIILILIGELIRQYLEHRILIHGNLLMLFVNIVIIIFINTITQFANSLRYCLLVFVYTNPCQLLTPLWLVSILVGSLYLQQICYPSLHFCVMLERLRATLFLDKYENEGRKLTLFMIIFSVRFFNTKIQYCI
uniref:Uncharacterized protein n=1 Tax=Meloidogyne enterolobii TaxID=390850 RepID=A0A6V7VT36_MELEN|nr:unnamed protein product [Meloidogyne enterolobii]